MSTMQARAAGESAFLGIRGKSSVTPAKKTGQSAATANSDEARVERSQKGRITRFKLQRQAQKLMPGYRNLGACGRNVQYRDMAPGVDVYMNRDTGKAHFANVTTCKSVWACPVCAGKITEERRNELQQAVELHAKTGGKVLLMTLTFPHERDDKLKDMLKSQSDAMSKFNATRAYRNLLNEVGCIGGVRALEVTHGENGWHPHVHTLLFVGKHEDASKVIGQARTLWAKAVIKAGLGQINEHGFDVRGGDYAAEYIAKFGKEPDEAGWGVTHELTKAPVKMGRKASSRTPFQMLADAMAGDSQAGALFVEYVEAFKGRRQLFWSPGLRDKLGMAKEKTDEEILAESEADVIEPDTELVGTLKFEDWRLVLSRNARGEVLAVAERHGWSGVLWLLEKLKAMPPSDDGWFDWEATLVSGDRVLGLMKMAA